jgi:hypothetical protein
MAADLEAVAHLKAPPLEGPGGRDHQAAPAEVGGQDPAGPNSSDAPDAERLPVALQLGPGTPGHVEGLRVTCGQGLHHGRAA